MIKSTVEKMAEPIGFEIGCSDDITQSNLINGLASGLCNSISSESKLEMQICYIVQKLDKKAIAVIRSMVDFIELKEN